jgi:hypothetical protein
MGHGMGNMSPEELLTHQLLLWSHVLVFGVVSLQLFIGHKLECSMRRPKQSRDVPLKRKYNNIMNSNQSYFIKEED